MHAYPDWISATLQDVESAVRTVALVVAGVWAYTKFIKGRIFHSKLEAEVSGEIVVSADRTNLAISMKIKNVGLSRVDIRQIGSGLRISAAEKGAPKDMMSAQWRHLGTFPILESHAWIEPAETVRETRLAILPAEVVSTYILLEAHIGSGDVVWIATCIVPVRPDARDSSTLGP